MMKRTSVWVTVLLAGMLGYSGSSSATVTYSTWKYEPIKTSYHMSSFYTPYFGGSYKFSTSKLTSKSSWEHDGDKWHDDYTWDHDYEWCRKEPPPEKVPEPSVLGLVGLGLAVLALSRRRAS